jgi:hypothetical protein
MKITNDIIKALLTQYTDLRDSDDMLVAWIWKTQVDKMNYPQLSADKFLQMMAKGMFPSSETITRTRRKVQEETPELRGKKYNERQAKQSIVKKDLGYK